MILRLPTARAAAATLAVLLLSTGNVWADDGPPEQVWLISTRRAPRGRDALQRDSRLEYSRLGPDSGWLEADREAFLASDDPAVPTCFFIHGNRETYPSAIQTGMVTYRRLKACRPESPVRFVIWSWPAARVCRNNRQDVQLKACRSDTESYYLARCLDRVRPDVAVSLVGYSFGARVITGALHIFGGGQVAGRGLAEPARADRAPLRVVLVAAALNNDWLLPGRRNGLALGQSERVLVTQNGCDPVLRFYPRLYGRRGPEALGFTGPACPSRLGNEREKIELLGVSCSVGKDHSWRGYLGVGALRAEMAQYVFLTPPPEQAGTE